MTPENALSKATLRQELRARIAKLADARRAADSERACALLVAQSIWSSAQSVLFYAALRDELDLSPMLARALADGKAVALPRFIRESGTYEVFRITDLQGDCARGKFGILEPSPACAPFSLNRLDLVLAPGVGFDEAGHRLGRGGGYYDRLLSHASGVKCGVLFDEQLVRQIPVEPHDIHMDTLLTPTRWLDIATRSV